ncbi:3-deoxy-D-manno-octulosonic acid transferase [Caulobacter sp. NIBR2454]|uniref:3-deoxy-D-manno-octulosonic acid transferase n=1 Tax=Caulobacter sp. NIBR2454 TaxID=3015996 RepID=UPI0022B6D4AB|nr:glycosyltransferase N-terminal domain-containing protein [Caulobacter sp. NIBR2454]
MSASRHLRLYRAATGLLEPVAPLVLRARTLRGKEDSGRLGERLGRASVARPDGKLVWLHGASVGESLSLLPLIEGLRKARPDLSILVTSGTATSAAMLRMRLPEGVIHQFIPVDAPKAVSRFLDHWRPSLGVFVESELWPNLITQADARKIRLALVSARVTEKSAAGWRKAPDMARELIGAFSLVLAQDDLTASRLGEFGASDDGRLNLKLVGAPLPADEAELKKLKKAVGKRPVLLAASTHPGEDEIILTAFKSLGGDALLILVPRHVERANAIIELARERGFAVGKRSAGDLLGTDPIYVADTLGELGLWFRMARGAFIGGSLIEGPGGHNPVEPAQLGCPAITGPFVDNWRSVYSPLVKNGVATVVRTANDLTAAFYALLKEPKMAKARAERALAMIGDEREVLEAAVRRLAMQVP